MRKLVRMVALLLVVAALLGTMAACGSSHACESCGKTPTKAYTNTGTDEKEYYCSKCSSRCEFCGGKATKYYTSLLGITFVCKSCYNEIMELNS